MRVKDKVIVVTGAGSGIGRELVLSLVSRGARIAGVDINAESLAETSSLIAGGAASFQMLVANVADCDAVKLLPEQVLQHFGPADAVINNAGIIQPFVALNNLEIATIERVLKVNLFGVLYVIKAFLPQFLARPEAQLVNLSSMGGFLPVPGQTVYCAAKAGVKLLSEGLASELMNTNVHVIAVFPGAIATNITQNSGHAAPPAASQEGGGKAMPAARAAELIIRGMERNARAVFVGRDSTTMNWLHRLNPGFAARMIAKKMSGLLAATSTPHE